MEDYLGGDNPAQGAAMMESKEPPGASLSSRPRSAASSPRAPRSGAAPADGLSSTLPPAPGRHGSGPTRRRNSPTAPGVQSYLPRRQNQRPISAPGAGKPYMGRLMANELYALTTPREELLHAPTLGSDAVTKGAESPRRPAAEELQYELSVTASVLRAAQDRLAKEREQRQLARVGEELALIDVKRARDEAKQVAEERRMEEKAVAKAMAEQRRALEVDLTRLESENEVRRPRLPPSPLAVRWRSVPPTLACVMRPPSFSYPRRQRRLCCRSRWTQRTRRYGSRRRSV